LVAHGHYQVVEVLDLLLEEFKRLLSVLLIGELFGELFEQFIDSVEKESLQVLKGLNVCLAIETVLEVSEKLGDLITEVVKFLLQSC
jgi:hypothetical protein